MISIAVLGEGYLFLIGKAILLLIVIPAFSMLIGYSFLLKMMSHMQDRLGPMEAGPHGIFQLLADGLKFLQKEDLMPNGSDRFIFKAAPIVMLVSTFLLYVVIPIGPHMVLENLHTGIFYVLGVSSISVIAILMAGWASSNQYSLLGALRAGGQLIAYEIPLVLSVVGVIIESGTLSLQGIVKAQANGNLFGLPIRNQYLISQFIGFFIFLISAQAELAQTPFDMPLAETEIVAGYMTEYSGFRFLLFYLSETATAFALSAIASTLFLGGWAVPFIHGTLAQVIGPFVLLAKTMLIAFLIFWFRFSLPRFREDQLQAFAWKFLIPLGLVNILITAIFKVAL